MKEHLFSYENSWILHMSGSDEQLLTTERKTLQISESDHLEKSDKEKKSTDKE